jgi:hypothetical protein
MYAIIMQSKETRYATGLGGRIASEAGSEHLVCDDEWGPTTRRLPDEMLPQDTTKFDTVEQADEFAKSWDGHPWTFKPNGKYRIVKLVKVTKSVIIGYTTAPDGVKGDGDE